jgi:RHS repeat-associated protein
VRMFLQDGRRMTGWLSGLLAFVTALLLAVTMLASVPPAAVAAVAGPPPKPKLHPVTGLAPVPYRPVKVSAQTSRKFTATATRWPAAASGTVTLAAPAAGATTGQVSEAAGTPAWVQPVAPHRGRWRGPSRMEVSVQAQPVSRALGIPGVVWEVSGLSAGAGGVRAGLSYKSFAQAYGGNYGSRLTLAELPACALTTPRLAACRKQTPLRTVNDYHAAIVSAVLPLQQAPMVSPAGAAPAGMPGKIAQAVTDATAVVLAATTTAGGDGGAAGTYGATPLKPAGSWTEGGDSGSFTYSYPIAVPGASTGLVPGADLSYDSGSVDGQTAATQAQAGWAGDGWSTGDSYIEQSFTGCDDSPEGVTLPAADQTEDMCYDGNILTMALDGSSTALVLDDSTGTWRLQSDDGSTVSHVTGSGNGTGTYNTDYWVITKRDGTRYYFGLNHLPGWASEDTATNSVDSEPVYSSQPGDPCYSSSGFTSSVCTMAYRWHLDYVTNAHGDAMAYYYHQDTNYYGEDNGAKDVPYVRDSYLTEIDYGFRAGGAYGTVPDEIRYGTSPRCVASSCPALSTSNSGTAGSDYPDVPFDLNCDSGATCTTYGPTNWSTVRLTSITTRQYSVSAAAYQDVDSYALTQTEPPTGDGTSPTLWLSSVTRTGDDTSAGGSSSAITLPAVSFTGTDLQDRVDTTNFPGLYRYRITSITNEMGGVTGVTYSTPDGCTASYVQGITTNAAAASNTDSCYPVWWTPPGYVAPVMDWFEKYAVTQVVNNDTTGGALAEQTDYSYGGGVAWHYDDNEVVKAKYRSYGQFRGYGTVTTYTGDGVNDPQTEQVTSYYRGMSDDNNSTAVTLTDSQGGSHDDANVLAGMPLETTVYNGKGGPVDHSTITSYWISAAAATRARSGLPALTATMVHPAETWTRQALTDGGTTSWRVTETDTTYNTTASSADFGLPTYVYSHTVPANPAYDRCTATSYAPANTAENLVDLPALAETDSVACSGFTEGSPSSVPAGLNTLGAPASVTRPDQVVSATETFYDDPGFSTTFPQSAAPTTGNVTMTRTASGYASGAFTWQTVSRDSYDSYGRVVDAYDGNGNETINSYTVNSAGLTTAQTVTNPLSQSTSQTMDPARGLALTATDANGVVTTEQYDALGRLTGVWLDSRATSAPANYTYAYTLDDPATHLSGITDKQMGENLAYVTTVTILDSLGRTRQTQTDTPQGGRLDTDQFYDSRGWVYKQNHPYWDDSTTPSLSTPLTTPADGAVPDQDVYVFNGLGQTVQDNSRKSASTVSVTTTVYNGDRTTVIPPTGGVIKSTVTDPLGRTSEIDEYTAAPTLVTPANTFTGTWYVTDGTTTATTYGYDGHGNQAVISDSSGNKWTSVYDLLGQVTSRTDPDAGVSTMSYDADGNLLQATDARGDTVSYTYDALDRKTGQYAAPTASQSSSNQMASWVYDNANNVAGVTFPVGQLTTETSYSGGSAYVIQQKGFNKFGESLGEKITIPAAAGTLAGTYTFSHAYDPNTGLPYSDTYPAAGGLPAETVGHDYLYPFDLPNQLSGTIDGYGAGTSYDQYGNVLTETIGTGSNTATLTNAYDPHTQLLTDQTLTRNATTPAAVDDEQYKYDPSGNITQQISTRLGSSSTSETQCFNYDALDRLSAAWTATDGCAATPTAASHATVGDGLGAASEYWTTYSYDLLGDLTSQVQHNSVTGGTDTTTTNTYNGNGTGQPHTLTSSVQSGGSTATSAFGYDKSGNMTTRDVPATGNQTLTWNAAGQLSSVTSAAGTTSYVYDGDGNLLLQEDSASWTLYLPGEQLTLTNPGGTNSTQSGVRIIPLPSGGDVVRTGSTTSYYFEIRDVRGTSTLYLDNTAQTPTWRQFTPYGASRGSNPTWIDNRGYLNKPADPVTRLTILGARQYDPVTAQFISPDPLLAPANPQDLDPYDYAQDNPVTDTDPTGLCANTADAICPGQTSQATQAAASQMQQYTDNNSTDYSPCASNITICLDQYYRAHGGQSNNDGIPTGRGYNPGPVQNCGAWGCSIITGAPNSAPSVIPRPVVYTEPVIHHDPGCGFLGMNCTPDASLPPIFRNLSHPGPSAITNCLWSSSFGDCSKLVTDPLPDYINLCLGSCITITRDGKVYKGPAAGLSFGGPAIAAYASLGYLLSGHGNNQAIDSFVNGPSLTVSGGARGYQGSVVWGNEFHRGLSSLGVEAGVGSSDPSISQSDSTYWFTLPWW